MTTSNIKAALRTKFSPPEWALFFEVGDATGGRQRRWADAVAMNLYPSRGLSVHGFEVKVSRSDWLRELKDPTKSGPVQQYCNFWWIVAPPGVVKMEELPPTWGLYELKTNGLHCAMQAPKLTPVPLTHEFVAAMLRRASEVDHAEVRVLVQKETDRHIAQNRENIDRQVRARTCEWETVQKRVEEIKKHSGIDLVHGYDDLETVGKTLRLLVDTGIQGGRYSHGIASLSAQLRRQAEQMDRALEAFAAPEAP